MTVDTWQNLQTQQSLQTSRTSLNSDSFYGLSINLHTVGMAAMPTVRKFMDSSLATSRSITQSAVFSCITHEAAGM